MKHLIISVFLSFFGISVAFAGWIEDFDENLATQDIGAAVEKALEDGKTATDIVDRSMEIKGLNTQNVLKSLYCAGVVGDDIKKAADQAEISNQILLAAFKNSVAECGDVIGDSQAYTPIAGKISFVGQPSPNPNPRPASSATF